MKRIVMIFGILIMLAGALYAADQYCPVHPYAYCNNTYERGPYGPDGKQAIKWHCSCGDDVWVK
jgi:hypothetical protein